MLGGGNMIKVFSYAVSKKFFTSSGDGMNGGKLN